MTMSPRAEVPSTPVDFRIVGSNNFGRDPKISYEHTYNMIVSNGYLVFNPGYKKRISLSSDLNKGRGLFTSKAGFMISVVGNQVHRIERSGESHYNQILFRINTSTGNVSIDENNGNQIGICDGANVWIYNYLTNDVAQATLPTNTQTGLPIKPGYIAFNNTHFLVSDISSSFWYLSDFNNGLNWLWGPGATPVAGSVQTKPDLCQAVIRVPGSADSVLVFGKNVTESWYYSANSQLFPFQKNTASAIDYGCLSTSTIATLEKYIVWLAINEKSGPTLFVSNGVTAERLSNDGFDKKLSELVNPEQSYAFLYREFGRIFYQITFYHPDDNVTYIFDLSTNEFYSACDENMDYHIAQRVAFYKDRYYFTSINDSGVYEISLDFPFYDYTLENYKNSFPPLGNGVFEIPRVRVTAPYRLPDTSKFIINQFSFQVEQGDDKYFKGSDQYYLTLPGGDILVTETGDDTVTGDFINDGHTNSYTPRVDISMSKDGQEVFGNYVAYPFNPQAKRQNRVSLYKLGQANEVSFQFRFWSLSPIAVSDGVMQIRHTFPGRA